MAGWSVMDGDDDDEGESKRCVSELPDKLRGWFDQLLGVFLREITAKDSVKLMPPMLGNGQRVDLFRLFWAVRNQGGFDCVSDNRGWDSVAGECGLGSGLGGAVKLVYAKYLYLLDRVFENKDLDWSLGSSGCDLQKQLADLQDEFRGVLREVEVNSAEMGGKSARKKRDVGDSRFEWDCGTVEDVGKLSINDEVKSEGVECSVGKEVCDGLVKSEGVECSGGKEVYDGEDYIDVMIVDPATMQVSTCRKRKQGSFRVMLDWLRMVSVSPCDPSVGWLPERSKWKSFGNGENWKQVLGAREAMLIKSPDSLAETINGQNYMRSMHPSMYDDQGTAYHFRERQRLQKQQTTMTESGAGFSSNNDTPNRTPEKPEYIAVRVASRYQAHVPEWTGESEESDMKWLGSRVWPLENPELLHLVERDPIGKRRQESCGCQMPGSIECVRFHIAEKRLRVKRELGFAFYLWKFNEMGEEVGLPWTVEEETRFKTIIDANPPSSGHTFWGDIVESFPRKSWKELVSFYFNVYHLQRRGYQNRFTPNNINSDDEEDLESETETETVEEPSSSVSILRSPHKLHGKRK